MLSLRRLTTGVFSRWMSVLPDHTILTMPALSPTMTQGNIGRWHVKVGEEFTAGDALAEIETDKATMDFESVDDGILAKILITDGTTDVQVNTPIGIVVETEEDVAAFANYAVSEIPESKPCPPEEASIANQVLTSSSSDIGSVEKVFASPLAKVLASDAGVSLNGIRATGFQGRIVADDVRNYQPAPSSHRIPSVSEAPVSKGSGGSSDILHTNMRKIIANRLLESKQNIPHYYLTVDVEADKMLELRASLNARLEKDGEKLSVNDFVIKAAAAALRKVPQVNSSWQPESIRQYDYVDMSVAVSTDTGLITPIIFNAHSKGLSDISRDMRDLAIRARENKLTPVEFQGGTVLLYIVHLLIFFSSPSRT